MSRSGRASGDQGTEDWECVPGILTLKWSRESMPCPIFQTCLSNLTKGVLTTSKAMMNQGPTDGGFKFVFPLYFRFSADCNGRIRTNKDLYGRKERVKAISERRR